jgi:hypothetical protein
MISHYCEICKQPNNGDNWVEKIKDKDSFIEINGHERCVSELHITVKNVKNLDKKSVQEVLKEIKFTPNQK